MVNTTTITHHQCDICKAKYLDINQAEKCEKRGVPIKTPKGTIFHSRNNEFIALIKEEDTPGNSITKRHHYKKYLALTFFEGKRISYKNVRVSPVSISPDGKSLSNGNYPITSLDDLKDSYFFDNIKEAIENNLDNYLDIIKKYEKRN